VPAPERRWTFPATVAMFQILNDARNARQHCPVRSAPQPSIRAAARRRPTLRLYRSRQWTVAALSSSGWRRRAEIEAGEEALSDTLTTRFASFIQHAWNTDAKRFRNFLSFDRRWLEDVGSEDSHGRAVWALGECSRSDLSPSRRRWASALFRDSLRSVEDFSSPRAWAFALLGLEAYCDVTRSDESARRSRRILSERLMSILRSVETPDWVWFETGLSYDCESVGAAWRA
jgi:hypothetical protein